MNLAEALVEAALRFLETGPPESACLPFDDLARRTWAYWPQTRAGVALWELDRAQAKAAHRMLATVLPLDAYTRVLAIMGLDEVLDRVEGYRSGRRHSLDYWTTVFGTPGPDPWGVRFEGHHVSVHATVAGGQARVTPLFLGANPAVVLGGAVAPLAAEERLGFELLEALSVEQRAEAVVAGRAPRDIVTRNLPRLVEKLPGGVPIAALGGGAARAARALLEVYLARIPEGARGPDPEGARFAWAGALEPGIGHYYRIAAPRLLIELDNTQDGANHVHTVVRDPGADFGDDLLAIHLRSAHG